MKMESDTFDQTLQDAAGTITPLATGTVDTPEKIEAKHLEELMKAISGIQEINENLEAHVTENNKTIAKLQTKLLGYLDVLKWDKFETSLGKAEIKESYRVSMPKTDEDKQALFDHLKAQGLFDRYATVHAQSLNSYYMGEWEAAKRKDPEASILFCVPGIEPPKLSRFLKVKMNKEGNE